MSDAHIAATRSAVVRGKVTNAIVGPRTLLVITGLDGEVIDTVEMLLPPGYSARPVSGADILMLQVLGSRDHMVAIGGDTAGADAISDLAPGEIGLRNGPRQIVLRVDHVEVTSDKVVCRAATSGSGTVEFIVPLPSAAGVTNSLYLDGSRTVKSSP
jgi:phage gp45-like